MSKGGTKQSKDAIARGPGHVALVAMDGIHHELEGRIDDRAGVLGIELLHEFYGAFDIGKEGSDGLALALRSAAGLHCLSFGQNTLG